MITNVYMKLFCIFTISMTYIMRANYTKFTIIIPSYNNSKWLTKNLNSVINQKLKNSNKYYPNYRIIYINDKSTDTTKKDVNQYIKKFDIKNLITVHHNKKRVGALKNIYNAVHSCKDNEVIVTVDGDDWLANDYVLDCLNKVYENKNIWLTYGQFIFSNGKMGWSAYIPSNVYSNGMIRSHRWSSSHLRTFYSALFKKIKKSDLTYNGRFFPHCWDYALMFPMLEMAGHTHTRFISEVLYVYNLENPISEYRVNHKEQVKEGLFIRSKASYKELKNLNFTNI